ncbi:MAG: GNAT family N-acetyltransferase [Bacteroidales bacterium]|nr:GNAT family N-acetyltransferase [Bacteroidales bacterium]
MTDYTIRKALPRDLNDVNMLLKQVLEVHHRGRPDLFKEKGKKYTDAELLDIFDNPGTPVFVYEKNGAVLGYAFCVIRKMGSGSNKDITTLYIDDLCVEEKARGHHIGTALFEHVKSFAKELGCHNITLHVWECNPGARTFYDSLEFKTQYTSMELVL